MHPCFFHRSLVARSLGRRLTQDLQALRALPDEEWRDLGLSVHLQVALRDAIAIQADPTEADGEGSDPKGDDARSPLHSRRTIVNSDIQNISVSELLRFAIDAGLLMMSASGERAIVSCLAKEWLATGYDLASLDDDDWHELALPGDVQEALRSILSNVGTDGACALSESRPVPDMGAKEVTLSNSEQLDVKMSMHSFLQTCVDTRRIVCTQEDLKLAESRFQSQWISSLHDLIELSDEDWMSLDIPIAIQIALRGIVQSLPKGEHGLSKISTLSTVPELLRACDLHELGDETQLIAKLASRGVLCICDLEKWSPQAWRDAGFSTSVQTALQAIVKEACCNIADVSGETCALHGVKQQQQQQQQQQHQKQDILTTTELKEAFQQSKCVIQDESAILQYLDAEWISIVGDLRDFSPLDWKELNVSEDVLCVLKAFSRDLQ